MFAVIGILVVFGAVIGGFLMEKGHIAVLVQPAELLILVGAAIGTLLVANPVHILKGIAAGLKGVLSGSKFNKQRYLNALKMMYQFLNKVRKEGLLSVEMDVEKPAESMVYKNFPEFLADLHARTNAVHAIVPIIVSAGLVGRVTPPHVQVNIKRRMQP